MEAQERITGRALSQEEKQQLRAEIPLPQLGTQSVWTVAMHGLAFLVIAVFFWLLSLSISSRPLTEVCIGVALVASALLVGYVWAYRRAREVHADLDEPVVATTGPVKLEYRFDRWSKGTRQDLYVIVNEKVTNIDETRYRPFHPLVYALHQGENVTVEYSPHTGIVWRLYRA